MSTSTTFKLLLEAKSILFTLNNYIDYLNTLVNKKNQIDNDSEEHIYLHDKLELMKLRKIKITEFIEETETLANCEEPYNDLISTANACEFLRDKYEDDIKYNSAIDNKSLEKLF